MRILKQNICVFFIKYILFEYQTSAIPWLRICRLRICRLRICKLRNFRLRILRPSFLFNCLNDLILKLVDFLDERNLVQFRERNSGPAERNSGPERSKQRNK